jgi:hypothetical protein
MARAEGLLGERQAITHAKVFKRAKRSLGIRSIRDGFGSAGGWCWELPCDRDEAAAPSPISRQPDRADQRAPAEWVEGVSCLDYSRPLLHIPRYRWRQFVDDCTSFLNSPENWAERAVALGWDATALFGCMGNHPLLHLGSAGLLWAIDGGRLVELHRDWAVIDRPVNRSQRIFYRRCVDAQKITLPWAERSRHLADR